MNLVLETVLGLKSLAIGLGLTLREFFKPTVTVRYPRQQLPMTKRYRGHIELTPNPEGAESLCIACLACQKACPSDCILVEGVKKEGGGGKIVTNYILNFTQCSLCGACIEACPVKPIKAIQFTQRYNLASTVNSYDAMDLVQRYKDQAAKK
jgi:NADH-quinone oxidoreductase subunit I